MKINWKKTAYAALAALSCLYLSSCGSYGAVKPPVKPVITILTEDMTSSMELYWTCLASKFPEVTFDISIYKTPLPEEALRRRVSHGDVADLTFSRHLSTDLPGLTECFMDLSGKPYISLYQTSYLNDLDVDGSVYYLPADLMIGGITYNKSLFQEKGWAVPRSYTEFAELCAACEESGIQPVYLSCSRQSQADLFLKCYAVERGRSLKGENWLRQFNNGLSSARDGQLDGVFSLLDQYAADGFATAEEVGLTMRDKQYKMARREVAMVGGDVTTVMSVLNASSHDEIRLMPFFSCENGEGYFFVYPMINLAVGKHVEQDPEKEKIVDEILRYLTSQEGQQDLMRYDKGVISPITGIPNKIDDPFYENLNSDSLAEKNLLKMPSFDHCAGVLDEMIGLYLQGEAERDEVVRELDKKNGVGKEDGSELILARAERNFTFSETNGLVLDAMRQAAGTDAALLMKRTPRHALDYQCLNGTLYEGDVTLTDLFCIHPYVNDVKLSLRLDRVTLTGYQLLELLPYRATYYYSGFTVQYRWNREMDNYIPVGLLNQDGEQLPLDDEYTVAILESSALRDGDYISRTGTSSVLIEAMQVYMESLGTLIPAPVSLAEFEK